MIEEASDEQMREGKEGIFFTNIPQGLSSSLSGGWTGVFIGDGYKNTALLFCRLT